MNNITIINETNEYINAFKERNDRYKTWVADGKADYVMKILEEIKELIIKENDYFKSNLYVKEVYSRITHNGKSLYSKHMKTIMLFSGKVTAHGYESENQKDFYSITESGFQLHFKITLNGKINVIVYGHYLEDREAEMKLLEVINHPKELTSDKIQELVIEGLKFAKTTSFLFTNY